MKISKRIRKFFVKPVEEKTKKDKTAKEKASELLDYLEKTVQEKRKLQKNGA